MTSPSEGSVLILGASPKPERYAHIAKGMLSSHNFRVVLVNPQFKDIEGEICYSDMISAKKSTKDPIHTVTVYVGEKLSTGMQGDFLALMPKRVVFNPGAENPILAKTLIGAGIEVVEACTLVMLRTSQF